MTSSRESSACEGRLVDSTCPMTISFEGKSIPASEGQSIAAALYAAGVRIFSRSFKYHRPRGLLCVSGDCPNCLMEVDGRPNVRTCIEPARPGQVVRGQNAWPSLSFDLLRVFDRLSAFLPVGFYYKRFHKPRWLWPIFEYVVRHLAGLGRINIHGVGHSDSVVEHLHVDVCVVGAGPDGLAAAIAAAEKGADVLLLEQQPRIGGHLLFDGNSAALKQLVADFERCQSKIRVQLETTAFGLYEGNLLGAIQGKKLLRIRFGEIQLCTGARERPFVFPNNDLPGVFLGRGVLRLARLYGVRAGQRAIVLTDNDNGGWLADQLVELGIDVVTVLDQRELQTGSGKQHRTLVGYTILRALGTKCLRGVEVGKLDSQGNVDTRSVQRIECDLLCMDSMPVPRNELARQGGGSADREMQAGAALNNSQLGSPKLKSFICFCEDVTSKDIEQAMSEGFDHIETLKRYTTVSMGPCQGKMCSRNASAWCARLSGREHQAVGTTTARPPATPVELGVLAADRRHHPIRRTPLHHWHDAAGAVWMDAGLWKRPESYGDPLAEVRAVRSSAGLIDVSTLGKIEIIGPDAAELLERTYLNSWSNLAVGRARYGVMCTEEGIIFDDGVGARLGPNHFYLTATTGNAESVFQWLELWRTTWRLDVMVLNRTSALAAMNLAGPRARECLSSLTQLDLSASGFPYLTVRNGKIVGVPCRILRIGFVGELGFEIHCPTSHAWHLWEAFIWKGKEFGLAPFGVEAQRVLRLEKGHFIIGQDTDALSNPLGAGLERMIRFQKPVFHGREALLRLQQMGERQRLVGFHLPASYAPQFGHTWIWEMEGCQVVAAGKPSGRVTSARYSPTLAKIVGLAWLPEDYARIGTRFSIRFQGTEIHPVVAATPFYDPQGKQLRS